MSGSLVVWTNIFIKAMNCLFSPCDSETLNEQKSYEIIPLIKKNKHCIIREYCKPYILKNTKIIYEEEKEFKKISASDFQNQKLTESI